MLHSFNPEPLEFYRYLNRKTKIAATRAYTSAISSVLTLSERIPKERMILFREIQEKWKNGVFDKDWNVYLAEKTASMSVMACYNVQRSYNRDVFSHSTKRKRDYPSTPNKPIIRPEMKKMYPQVSFTKKVKVVAFGDKDSGGSEKDDQKTKVTLGDGLETLEEDDQNDQRADVTFEDELEVSEKHDPNDQNPFIALNWREWLETILKFSIEEVRIKILTYQYTPANEFEETMIKYIGKVLMDFVNKIIDIPGHVMTIDEIERDWIVNKISPLFTYMQATFINSIKFHWIEHDVEPTHERLRFEGNTTNKDRMKADIIGVRLSDSRQVVFLEMSGAPTDFLKAHPVGDTCKTIQERIDSLNSMLLNYLDYDIRFAEKIHSLTIQGIRDRLTLRTLSLRGKEDYKDEEEISAVFPICWNFRFQFIEIFELMEFVIISVLEYPDIIKELSKHPAASSEFAIRNCISYHQS
ncbi:10494_t:CDS:2 [Paraglomus occultum]|uniref:10494_t:CDS:1 n=1 Tax=Paraglomus occultum TaxID=144539 RepID=A0A9N9AKE0_9GLOM|nr:10494_t:CDS:2 [Paraglomus occultum]